MTPYRWRRLLGALLLVMLTISLASCAALKPKVEPLSATTKAPSREVLLASVNYKGIFCYLHEVRWSEETLSVIARWYTGKESNARILARVTPNLRKQDLRKGDVVFIPQELTQRTDPLTRSYARRYGRTPARVEPSKPQLDPSKPKVETPQDDGFLENGERPVPYGPRTYPD